MKNYGTKIARIMFIAALLLTVIGVGKALAQASSDSIPKLTKEVIYKDVKDVLKSLGETLKVGTEHVYEVLIRQQVVSSITWTIIYLVGIWGFITCSRWAKRILDETSKEGGYIAAYIYLFILLLLFLFTIETTVTGFVNPEYGAIEKIVNMLK